EMWIVEHLFLDSLLFLRLVPSTARSLADIGSGAGMPGVPIRIVRSDAEVTLVESRRRRASFFSALVRELPPPWARHALGEPRFSRPSLESSPWLGRTSSLIASRVGCRILRAASTRSSCDAPGMLMS